VNPTTPPGSDRSAIDARTLWAGGAATAIVAALIVLVGHLVVDGLFDISLIYLGPDAPFDSQPASLMFYVAIAALLATLLAQLLMISTPRAMSFFSWIMALATAVATLLPFTYDAELESKLTSAAIYLIVGIAITSLIGGVARTARRRAIANTPPAQ
jgi:hypothetical protein